MRRTFNIRFSDDELRAIKLKAQARGWSVGHYVRFKALGTDRDQETRISSLESRVKQLQKQRND